MGNEEKQKGSQISVKAPGRVCLFGEHLDYLGLYVISAALDLYITIRGIRRVDRRLHIILPDIGQEEWIDLTQPLEYRKHRDYLRSVVKVLQKRGVDFPFGTDCTITGNIPFQAGVSSSSALVIAWTTFLLTLAESPKAEQRELIAELGYEAEVREFNEAGGMMDQYTSSFGGVLWIDCQQPFHVNRLRSGLAGFVLGDSLEAKDTQRILSSVRGKVQEGFSLIRRYLPSFDHRSTQLREVALQIHKLPEDIRKKVHATLIDRDLALEAKTLFESPTDDFDLRLGALLTRHHEQLRDGLEISTPKIERMINGAMNAGALGCKINGSGGGGCMFAYAPDTEEAVAEAIKKVDGKPYIVKVSHGVQAVRGEKAD